MQLTIQKLRNSFSKKIGGSTFSNDEVGEIDHSDSEVGSAFIAEVNPQFGSIGAIVSHLEENSNFSFKIFSSKKTNLSIFPRFYIHALSKSCGKSGPAELAGLRPNDLIIGVQEIDLCDPNDPWTLLKLVTYFRDMISSDGAIKFLIFRPYHKFSKCKVLSSMNMKNADTSFDQWPFTPNFPNLINVLFENEMVPTLKSYQAQTARLLQYQIYNRSEELDSGKGYLGLTLSSQSKTDSLQNSEKNCNLKRKALFEDFMKSLPSYIYELKDSQKIAENGQLFMKIDSSTRNLLKRSINTAVVDIERTGDDTVYTIYVFDMESGEEWRVKKTWTELFEFQAIK